MTRTILYMSLSLALNFSPLAVFAQAPSTNAPAADQKPKGPSYEERLADIEAYISNSARPSAANTNITSNIPGPGPGHNAWMMASAALVLFMTLPGLALFYGGLVRRKNVLSVLAQCLGTAGLVTILWWAFGYSLVFGANFKCPFLG